MLFMKAEEIDAIIGRNLRRLRTDRGLSQRDLSEKIGTYAPRLSALESGSLGMGKEIMARICTALKCRPYELFIDEDTPIITDAHLRHAISLMRRAEEMGVAEKIEEYGEFLVGKKSK